MGKRGPLPGTIYGKRPGPVPNPERAARLGSPKQLPRASRIIELASTNGPMPDPPEHLAELGRQVWSDVFGGLPPSVVDQRLDHLAVLRLAELAEDRAVARKVLVQAGPLTTEPIVSHAGAVVGTRILPNPAAEMVRKYDQRIDALSDRLGLSPAARARLGLTISQAHLAAADATSIMAKMRRHTEGTM